MVSSQLTRLQALRLPAGSLLPHSALRPLAALTQLQKLVICGNLRCNAATLADVALLTSLTALTWHLYCTAVDIEVVLPAALSRLQRLEMISHDVAVDEDSVARLRLLTYLALPQSYLDANNLANLAAVAAYLQSRQCLEFNIQTCMLM